MCFIYNELNGAPVLSQKIQISKDESGEYILNWDGKQAVLKNEDIKNQL